MSELKPCPFCGGDVVAIIGGSHVYIGCCAEMSLQKSDVLTLAERATWGQKPFRYSDEAEEKALQHAISMWNIRPGEDKLQDRVDAWEWLREVKKMELGACQTGDALVEYTNSYQAARAAVEKK